MSSIKKYRKQKTYTLRNCWESSYIWGNEVGMLINRNKSHRKSRIKIWQQYIQFEKKIRKDISTKLINAKD